jgi:PIN domain nuclease of toxin-antitoxin system
VNPLLADTHAIIWYFEADPRLSVPARTAMRAVEAAGGIIYLSAITFVEMRYLVERARIPAQVYLSIRAAVSAASPVVRVLPVTELVADAFHLVPRLVVPDMPDRIIAATAVHHGLTLVTADSRIRQLTIPIIW